jgi:mRNA interferase MazF
MPTVTYERFEVVRVPFPFTDRSATKARPALVLSSAAAFNEPAGQSVLAMITSAEMSARPLDVPVQDLMAAGLPAAPLVRMKLFTLDHQLIRGRLGRLAKPDGEAVLDSVKRLLSLTD